MTRTIVILLAVLFVGLIFAMIVPMWIATAGMGLPATGWVAVLGTVIFCFAIGGGLMFLIFYSARQGYDERGQMHTNLDRPPPPSPPEEE